MTVRICIGIRFPLSSYMIYYGPQLDIWVKTFARKNSPESSLLISWCLHRYPALCGDPEERVWPFVFAMGIIFQQRLSQHIIKIYRTTKSKVMAIRICVGIRFPLSSSMIYYWAQSDIQVKTFASQNFPKSSLLVSGCLHRFPALCGDPEERVWPFVFSTGFIFQQRRSQHIIKIYRTTESKVMAIRICVGIRFPLSSSMIYYGAQSDIRGQTFNCSNLLECSSLISRCLNRFLTLRGDLEETLWLFVFVIGFIFQQRRSQYIIKIYRKTESKVMTVRICFSIRFPLSSYMIYYGPQLDIWVKTFARQN